MGVVPSTKIFDVGKAPCYLRWVDGTLTKSGASKYEIQHTVIEMMLSFSGLEGYETEQFGIPCYG
jgi:hypothetical protein